MRKGQGFLDAFETYNTQENIHGRCSMTISGPNSPSYEGHVDPGRVCVLKFNEYEEESKDRLCQRFLMVSLKHYQEYLLKDIPRIMGGILQENTCLR